MGAYIPDGYIAKGYLKGERNGTSVLWEPLRFRYRPATAPEVEALNVIVSPAVAEQNKVEFLAKHLVEWDLKHNNKILPISAEVLSRLIRGFRQGLMNIIDGSFHSDDDPDDPTVKAGKIDLVAEAGNLPAA